MRDVVASIVIVDFWMVNPLTAVCGGAESVSETHMWQYFDGTISRGGSLLANAAVA